MLILGIDTSGKTASCALCTETAVTAQYSLAAGSTHSQVMLPLVKRLIADSGHELGDIQLAAVACGPGSYTGLRIGIAAVKALVFGINETAGSEICRCCGVSTLLSLAYNFMGMDKTVCSVMHARKDLAYTAMFRTHCNAEVERLTPDEIIPVDEIYQRIRSGGTEVFAVGDMSAELCSEYDGSGLYAAPPHLNLPLASSLCFAAQSLPCVTPDELLPDYLQPTLAEKQAAARKI